MNYLCRCAWSALLAVSVSHCGVDADRQEKNVASVQQAVSPDISCSFAKLDGREYWFCKDARTFSEARANCRSQGLDVASVENAQENEFVRSHAADHSYLGLVDVADEGAFRWSASGKLSFCGGNDGKSTSSKEYSAWAPYQPLTSSCRYETRNGRAYWFCDNRLTWDAASQACESVGMTLARADDAAENTYLRSQLMAAVWLGATDNANEGSWRWQDDDALFWGGGRAGARVGGLFSNWAQNNPADASTYNCLSLHSDPDGSWHSEPCAGFNAWVCEGDIPIEPELPEAHDCVTLSQSDGTWTNVDCNTRAAYVCETPPPNAGKTLDDLTTGIRDDYRSGKPRVSHATFADESSVREPFSIYTERLGLRACVDALEPRPHARSYARAGQEIIDYRQTYRSIPVMTRGYVVHRDAVTKEVASFTGRIEHGLVVDTTPQVQELNAFLRACESVGLNWALYGADRPQGELVVWPVREGKQSLWELGWHFDLPAQGARQRHLVVVSAKTGDVLASTTTASAACPSISIKGPLTDGTSELKNLKSAKLTISALQQTDFGEPGNFKGMRLVDGASEPYVLVTNGLADSTDPQVPLSYGPLMFAQCPGERYPQVVTLPTDHVAYSYSDDAHTAAGIFTGAQRCLEFFASTLRTGKDKPWQGIDGDGVESIDLRLYNDPADPNARFYEGRYATFEVNFMAAHAAGVEIPCHELSHGLWGTFVDEAWKDSLDTASVQEGFADVLAEVAEMKNRSYLGDRAYCVFGDAQPDCERDLKDPNKSTSGVCQTYDASGTKLYEQCPAEYGGPDFCWLPQCGERQSIGCCDSHANATVLGRWFYLVTTGDVGENKVSCTYDVPPLHAELQHAAPMAARILFNGVRDGYFAERSGFEGIADATIQSAKELFGPDSAEVRSVVAAWYAVNVKENHHEGVPSVAPVRNQGLVYPWFTFKWPVGNGESAWDLEVVTGSFSAPTSRHAVSNITSTVTEGTLEYGTLKVALPFNDQRRFFWRVRPHDPSGSAWTDCYPIHSFIETLEPQKLESATVLYYEVEEDVYRAGNIGLAWNKIAGAVEYKVVVSKQAEDTNCTGGGESIEVTVEDKVQLDEFGDAKAYASTDAIYGLEPEETYVIQIMPIGPKGFDGKPSEGACFKKTIRTAPMRAPALITPKVNDLFYYGESVNFQWMSYDAPEQYELEFFERDYEGKCVPSGRRETVIDPCTDTTCSVAYERPLAFDANPTGYCWSVTSVAKNGKRSPPSEPEKLTYLQRALEKIAPGIGEHNLDGKFPVPVGVLPKDSYGDSVTFSWEAPLAGAYDYMLKIGKTDWRFNFDNHHPRDPDNCAIFSCRREPDELTYRAFEFDNSVTLSADEAGRGRYCWTVWPRFPYNGSLQRQPGMIIFPLYCYTTGPATPEPVVNNPPDPTQSFTSEPITGYIDFPYVPDYQFQVGANSSDITIDPLCEPSEFTSTYKDVYDCRVQFTIKPQPETEYVITPKTWHSDVHPAVKDDSTLVYDEPIRIRTGACGGEGQGCCAESKCDADNLVCFHDKCVQCGDPGEACCSRPSPQPLCNSAGNEYACGKENKCVHCGAEGEECCDFGLKDYGGDWCQAGHEACRDGYCRADMCQTPGMPTMGQYDDYQAYCRTTSGCNPIDDDLCLPKCDLTQSIPALIENHIVPCTSGLSFLWGKAPGATTYTAYVAPFGSGTTEKRVGIDATAFTSGKVVATPDIQLFTIVARGENSCGKKGAPGVGMIAVSAKCP